MKTVWYKDRKNEEHKKRIRGEVVAARPAFIRLAEILEEMIAADRSSKLHDYDDPNWALKQADSVGSERALREVIKIIS